MDIDWLNGNSITTSMGGIRIEPPYSLHRNNGVFELSRKDGDGSIVLKSYPEGEANPDEIWNDYRDYQKKYMATVRAMQRSR